jgi:thymidine phosphorylase
MRLRAGQPLITLHTDTPERFARAREALEGAYAIGNSLPDTQPLIMDRIT